MRYLMIALILLISSNVSGKESEVRPLLPHGLTDKEVSDLTGPALDGSGDAAWRLAQVYMIAPYVPEKLK